MIFRDLIFNAALLLSLSMLYSQVSRDPRISVKVRSLLGGLLFGAIALAGMMYPYQVEDGVIIDGRSIVLSVAGFCGGWVTAGIASIIAAAFRLLQGGFGAWPSFVGIFLYAALGVGFRLLSRKYPKLAAPIYIYIFGIFIHLITLSGILVLPSDMAYEILGMVALPIMVIFPLAFLFLTMLMNDLENHYLTEARLRESEAQYRALFDDSFSVMLIVDPVSASIIDANNAACKFYGWSYDDLTRKKITKINSQSAKEIEEVIAQSNSAGRDSYPFQHRLASGEIRDVDVYISPISIESQSLLYYIVHDVTKRRLTEQTLREFRRRYKEMLDNVEMIAVSLDSSGAITYCNPYLLTLTNWKHHEVIGKNWFEKFIPPEIKESLENSVFNKTYPSGEVKPHHVNDIVTHDGRRRTISWNNIIFRDLDGEVLGTTSLGEDITDRLEAEKALRKSERMLAIAQRMAQIGSWEWEIDTGQVSWSREVYEICGVAPDGFPLEITSVIDMFHPEDRFLQEEVIEQISRNPDQFQFEARILWPDNSVRHVMSMAMGQHDEDGNLFQISGTVQDITERKQAEKELIRKQNNLENFVNERTAELAERMQHVEQLNKGMVNLMQDLQIANQRSEATTKKLAIANTELENFAYSVSHDLRAPLRSISGFAHILADRHRKSLDDQGKQYVDYVVTASIQMGKLIDDLLEYSRLGRRAVQTRQINCKLVLDDALNDLQERIENTRANIILPDHYPIVEANHTLLKQIFLNLIDNALIYCKEGHKPEIKVTCQLDSEYAIISVQDQGMGIAEEHFVSIFNMFQRLHQDDQYLGTGIGLALVKKAVTLMHGEIWVESEIDVGSTFWVKIPLSQDDAE